MVLTRSSPAASKAADIAVPSSSIRMKSHPSPGAPSPGAPVPSASRIQTRSSPNIAAAGPSVGAPGPSSSAGHTISPKSNQKKHKMPILMKMNDGSVVDKVLEFEVFFRFRICFFCLQFELLLIIYLSCLQLDMSVWSLSIILALLISHVLYLKKLGGCLIILLVT